MKFIGLLLTLVGAPVERYAPYRLPIEAEVVTVVIRGGIDEATTHQFRLDMEAAIATGQPVIPVEIDSYGGYVYSFMAIADIIAACPVPVATICVGKCMSAGAMILMQGTEGLRFAAPNSTILIHDVSGGAEGKTQEIDDTARKLRQLNTRLLEQGSRKIGKAPNYLAKLLDEAGHADIYMLPSEAKKHNIVNVVGYPRFSRHTFIKVTYDEK